MNTKDIRKALEHLKNISIYNGLYEYQGKASEVYKNEIHILEQAIQGLELMGSFVYGIQRFTGESGSGDWIYFDGMEGECEIKPEEFELLAHLYPEKTSYAAYYDGTRILIPQNALKPFELDIMDQKLAFLMTPTAAIDEYKRNPQCYVKVIFTKNGSVVCAPTDNPDEATSVEQLQNILKAIE